MLVLFKKTAVIVDQMAFRRARIESFLEPWAKDENVELISLQPEHAHARLVEDACDMLVYNVGGAHPSACDVLAEIQVLHTLCPTAALVILSDDTSQVSIGAAMSSGARGYLINSMSPAQALQALSLVLHGGTYFPPTVILTGQGSGDVSAAALPQLDFSSDMPRGQTPAGSQQVQVSFAGHEGGIVQTPCFPFDETSSPGPHSEEPSGIECASFQPNTSELQLTDRQQAILRCLCRGDSNKLIARNFDIAESTVKIHVKSILRKIHVKNRTQAAIWAIQNGLYSATNASAIIAKKIYTAARLI